MSVSNSESLQTSGPSTRTLTVVLYPILPNFPAFKNWVVAHFENRYPAIHLNVIDLSDNYYGSFVDDYIGCAKADIYEIDSVFLNDFAINQKIQPLPASATEPGGTFLKNAETGVKVKGVQYGAPHWVCGNFLFFVASDKEMKNLTKLDELKAAIGPHPSNGRGLAVDLKGKSTLGEFYLNAAVDRYNDWDVVKKHIAVFDSTLETDLVAIRDLCEGTSCRDSSKHGTTFFAQEFGAKKARALVGYSESLNGTLALAADKSKCPDLKSCLQDKDIDVEELPIDPQGSKTMSWVDSFTIDINCKDQCATDAVNFIHFMNEDDTYMAILLGGDGIPAYLLPAKGSLYKRQDLLQAAHLYPKLRTIVENSVVPSDLGLNDELRNTGRVIDADLSKP
jgi:thiamine pyridinylase